MKINWFYMNKKSLISRMFLLPVISFIMVLPISGQVSMDNDIIIERNSKGFVQAMYYPNGEYIEKPTTSQEFFEKTLKVQSLNDFVSTPRKSSIKGMNVERYQQYYKGVKVDNAHYTFHYIDGKMSNIHGNYVPIHNLDVTPSISGQKAIELYASYNEILSHVQMEKSSADILVKEVPLEQRDTVLLVYKVCLFTDNISNIDIGYIDAHSGEVVYTEPSVLCNSVATGTFQTRYNGSKNGKTELVTASNSYRLYDSTRGNGIHTRMYNYYNQLAEYQDGDNNWTYNELGSDYQIGLDVYWTLQQLYDIFSNQYGVNSYDGNGEIVNSYITSISNAYWNQANKFFNFGYAYGSNDFYPLGSVDVIAHEYGHAISTEIIGWTNTNSLQQNSLHEGLSDIWAVIMENNIKGSSSMWKIGEQVTKSASCLRNIANPSQGLTPIAHEYGYGLSFSDDPHVRSGIFLRWFYLLVNGGSGLTEKGYSYNVSAVGINLAKQLIANAVFNSYLEDCDTYVKVRNALIATANAMGNSSLAQQVANAWHAVGVESVDTFCGVYTQESCTYHGQNSPSISERLIKINSPMIVHQGCRVIMKSDYFKNATITSSGSTPDLLYYDGDRTLILCLPYSTSTNQVNLTISGGQSATTTYLYFKGLPPGSSLPVNAYISPSGSNSYTISIVTDSETKTDEAFDERNKTINEYDAWTLSVFEATSGKLVMQEKHDGVNYEFSTSGWKPGIYIAQVYYKGQIVKEKIIVN